MLHVIGLAVLLGLLVILFEFSLLRNNEPIFYNPLFAVLGDNNKLY